FFSMRRYEVKTSLGQEEENTASPSPAGADGSATPANPGCAQQSRFPKYPLLEDSKRSSERRSVRRHWRRLRGIPRIFPFRMDRLSSKPACAGLPPWPGDRWQGREQARRAREDRNTFHRGEVLRC